MDSESTDPASIASKWCYKWVDFEALGERLEFALSHAIFSSDRIDSGSQALIEVLGKDLPALKRRRGRAPRPISDPRSSPQTVSQAVPLSVYDIGCGCGVLGIAAAAALGPATVLLEDRDALSVEIAALNARHNGLCSPQDDGPPGTGKRRAQTFFVSAARPTGCADPGDHDLILCNLPAKAGSGVRDFMIAHATRHLGPAGSLYLVVVNTIATESVRSLEHAIRSRGGDSQQIVSHPYPGHTVIVTTNSEWGSEATKYPSALPSPYIGDERSYVQGSFRYSLRTINGLGEFDGPSYLTRMLLKLTGPSLSGRTLCIFEPGVGHVPVALRNVSGAMFAFCRNTLSAFSLEQINLCSRIVCRVCATPSRFAESVREFDRPFCVVPVNPEPHTPYLDEVEAVVRSVGQRSGTLVLAGPSGAISRLERRRLALPVKRRGKGKGIRGLVFE